MESGSSACTTTTTHDSASGCSGWSLKKSKRDAAHQRRVQAARSLKLRARLEVQQQQQQVQQQRRQQDTVVARVDHQQRHLRRLKIQRSEESDSLSPLVRGQQQLPADNGTDLPNSPWDFSKPLSLKDKRDHHTSHGMIWSWGGKGATSSRTQHQKQSMRAAVESRRRLARGPRSGSTVEADAQAGVGGQPMLPSEDHRVVSTVYQAAETQALMRVTLLAAGFVIGARGISARLIGQVTGAIVQSWTESCRPDSVPIRLFRIQGKKAVVQAAVVLIEQAVAKYKELCECKRRGEFVQREHVINGVEFYYQPPPRKAFANSGNEPSRQAEEGSPRAQLKGPVVAASAPIASHHAWLQHLQQQQVQAVAAQQQKQQAHISLLDASQGQVVKGEGTADCLNHDHSDIVHQSHAFFDWQPQVERQLMGLHSADLEAPQECVSEFELLDHGLQQSVASLEQALQQVRLEQHLLQRNRSMSSNSSNNNNNNNNDNGSFQLHRQAVGNSRHSNNQESSNNNNYHNNNNNLWVESSSPGSRASRQTAASPAFQLGPSLFFFGDGGGLPLPKSLPDDRSSETDSANCIFLDAAPCSPFDFPHCDFLRESLPTLAWAAATREMPEYSLYEASPLQEEVADSFCIVCLEQPACVHLVPCGHNLFCFSCVGGLLTCPICRQPIVALHPRGKNPVTPDTVDLPNNLNTSSYNMWNWIPGASV